MSQSIEKRIAGQMTYLSGLSDVELDLELSSSLEITANALLRLAIILKIKEDRGHDLSQLKIGMIEHLRRIATGQLLPEVVVRWADRPSVIRRLAKLTIDEQRERVERDPNEQVAKYKSRPSGRTSTTSEIVLDKAHDCIVVSGNAVRVTKNELIVYLRRLGWDDTSAECPSCGADIEPPEKCRKCGKLLTRRRQLAEA